jgi:hypothetical protein
MPRHRNLNKMELLEFESAPAECLKDQCDTTTYTTTPHCKDYGQYVIIYYPYTRLKCTDPWFRNKLHQ